MDRRKKTRRNRPWQRTQPSSFREDASKRSRHDSNLLSRSVIRRVASDDVTPELCWLPAQPAGLRDVGNAQEHCCKTLTGSAGKKIPLPVSLRLPFFAHKQVHCVPWGPAASERPPRRHAYADDTLQYRASCRDLLVKRLQSGSLLVPRVKLMRPRSP